MNGKIFLAAFFIAILATTTAYSAPSMAVSSANNTAAQRAPSVITIPSSMQYEINGTLIAWANMSGYALATMTLPNGTVYGNFNMTIRSMYMELKITLTCDDITVNSTTGEGSADVTVVATVLGHINIYMSDGVNPPQETIQDIYQTYSATWEAKYFVPWGDTKNFTIPFGLMGAETTGDPTDLRINFTPANITSDSIQSSTIRHVSWDFGNWMKNKVNTALSELLGSEIAMIQAQIPGLQTGFNIPVSTGKADLWLANATVGTTEVPNVLLMAGAAINFLLNYYAVGQGRMSIPGYGSMDFNINLRADIGVAFGLSVTSDYFRTNHLIGNNYINTFDIQVPENATFVWKRVGVIIYYGSPAHGIDVTAGTSRAYYAYLAPREDKLFFVDYGRDGTPDFATNGTDLQQMTDYTKNVTGTGNTRTVTLKDKADGTWVYFKVEVPYGWTVKSVSRVGATASVNGTQYYVENGVLYVCDDPAYQYTVTLIPPAGGLSILLMGGIAVVALAGIALLLIMRRKSASKAITIQ